MESLCRVAREFATEFQGPRWGKQRCQNYRKRMEWRTSERVHPASPWGNQVRECEPMEMQTRMRGKQSEQHFLL